MWLIQSSFDQSFWFAHFSIFSLKQWDNIMIVEILLHDPFYPFFFKEWDNDPLCSKCKTEKIISHKTYLVLGSSPKFHIESLGGTFFRGTRTFRILMVNALRGTFLPLGVSQLWSHACEETTSSLSFFPVPSEVTKMWGSFFGQYPGPSRNKDPEPFTCCLVDWACFTTAK